MKLNVVLFLAVVSTTMTLGTAETALKNIVFMMADDLGHFDVSFTGGNGQIMTPNMDMLAYSGVALNRMYSHSLGPPTRTAVLTGIYAHKLGMQGPLPLTEDRGIPTNTTLWPEYLQKAGYKTHIIGKWHVGASQSKYLPTNRGFDSHWGHRSSAVDYYAHTAEELLGNTLRSGLVLYDGLVPAWDSEGYLTDLYTEKAKSVIENHDTSSPLFLMVNHAACHTVGEYASLQAPPETVREMRHVELTERQTYGAMVKKLDYSVGVVFKALYDKGMLNNTLLVFSTDSGAMTLGSEQNYGCNWPMRGMKSTPWEGAVRGPAFIWSQNLTNKNHYWNGYMHMVDMMPTLLGGAGVDVPSGIDGINHWDNINANAESERTTMIEINDYNNYSAVIYGNYKMITGNLKVAYSGHLCDTFRGIIEARMPSYTDTLENSTVYSIIKELGLDYNVSIRSDVMNITCEHSTDLCTPDATSGKVCLYNIIDDPCENTDLSGTNPDVVTTMQELLANATAQMISRVVPYVEDPLSAPKLNNYTWGWPWITSS